MSPYEDELLQKAITGDTTALCELLERYGPEVRCKLRIAPAWRPMVSAEDVMQVTYLEAFLQIGRFAPGGKGALSAWLRRIAENNLRDAVKALECDKRPPVHKRVTARASEDPYAALIEKLGATTTTPSRLASREENKGAIEAAVQELPEDYQTVVRLYDLGDLSAAEVARLMGRTSGAVYMLRARAHDRLRDIMGSRSDFL